MARRSATARAASFGATGAGAISRQEVAAMFDNLGSDAQLLPMNLTNAKSGAAWTTAVGATPAGGVMGLAATPGAGLVGATSNNTSTSDTAGFFVTVPAEYTDGSPLSVRVRAKISALRQVSGTIAVSVKKYADAALGSELNTTGAKNLTTSFADYDFTITPTGLAAGMQLWVVVTAANNDTGGSSNGFTTVSVVSLVASVFG
jgi:hypothetical protein